MDNLDGILIWFGMFGACCVLAWAVECLWERTQRARTRRRWVAYLRWLEDCDTLYSAPKAFRSTIRARDLL